MIRRPKKSEEILHFRLRAAAQLSLISPTLLVRRVAICTGINMPARASQAFKLGAQTEKGLPSEPQDFDGSRPAPTPPGVSLLLLMLEEPTGGGGGRLVPPAGESIQSAAGHDRALRRRLRYSRLRLLGVSQRCLACGGILASSLTRLRACGTARP